MESDVKLSSASVLTLWYLALWNKALKSKYLRETFLKRYLEASFESLGEGEGSARRRKALPWLRSRENIIKISSIFLNCLPLRKLIPVLVDNGFFFDRMIEYSIALKGATINSGQVLLDIGPFHSIFPSYVASYSYTIAIDINRDAIIFQKKISKIMGKNVSARLECVLADATQLPFRDDTFDKIFVISTIEHIEKDNLVAKECGRVLKKDGYCVLSLPFSKLTKEPQTRPYFSRFYTRKMIQDRIIIPSLLSLKELFFFNKTLVSTFYACVPEGWFIFKDLTIGVTLFKVEGFFLSKDEGNLAIIKLHKKFRKF